MALSSKLESKKIITFYSDFINRFKGILPLSANVDLMLFLLGQKQCFRTRIKSKDRNLCNFFEWVSSNNFYYEIKQINYLYIGIEKDFISQVSKVDHSHKRHERELGILLGYPICCVEKIAEVGEEYIDDFENWLITQSFEGAFQLINPVNYRKGFAFISHVPCSTKCQESLAQALLFSKFLIENKNEKLLNPWIKELEKINLSL